MHIELLASVVVSLNYDHIVTILNYSNLRNKCEITILTRLAIIACLGDDNLVANQLRVKLDICALIEDYILVSQLQLTTRKNLAYQLLVVLTIDVRGFIYLSTGCL